MIITTEPVKQDKKSKGTDASREEIGSSNKENRLSIFFLTVGNPLFLFYSYSITTEEFPGTEMCLIGLYTALLFIYEFVRLYKTEPMSIKTVMHPICAIALILIVYKTQIPAIKKIISHYKVLELNEEVCYEGDNKACYNIATSARRIGHERHTFKYYSKACAFEHQGACSWIRGD
jgi:hypothetical protein